MSVPGEALAFLAANHNPLLEGYQQGVQFQEQQALTKQQLESNALDIQQKQLSLESQNKLQVMLQDPNAGQQQPGLQDAAPPGPPIGATGQTHSDFIANATADDQRTNALQKQADALMSVGNRLMSAGQRSGNMDAVKQADELYGHAAALQAHVAQMQQSKFAHLKQIMDETGAIAGSVTDQTSLDQATQQLKQLGIPTPSGWPTRFDDAGKASLSRIQQSTLTAAEKAQIEGERIRQQSETLQERRLDEQVKRDDAQARREEAKERLAADRARLQQKKYETQQQAQREARAKEYTGNLSDKTIDDRKAALKSAIPEKLREDIDAGDLTRAMQDWNASMATRMRNGEDQDAAENEETDRVVSRFQRDKNGDGVHYIRGFNNAPIPKPEKEDDEETDDEPPPDNGERPGGVDDAGVPTPPGAVPPKAPVSGPPKNIVPGSSQDRPIVPTSREQVESLPSGTWIRIKNKTIRKP